MTINPNWPILEDSWGPYWNAASGAPSDRFVEVTPRTMGKSSVHRGRQYELDQVRTGELTTTLSNTDGVLDPVNGAGPFAGHIQPYQPYRRRAQWPPTVNLLSQVTATGGDLGGVAVGSSTSASDVFSNTDPSGSGTVTASGTAWQGATVFQFSVPSATVAPTRICHTPQTAVVPGQTYTMQMRCRNVTASTTLQVQAGIGWYDAAVGGTPTTFAYGSTVTLTGSATASWTQVTVTATAPAGAAGVDVGVMVAATAAATCTVQVDGWQLEKGTSASTWTTPGVWYPMYQGFVERWPSQWANGFYGTVSPVAVDALALFSQVALSDPLTQEINSHSPRFLYRLDDPAGSGSASDAAGNCPPIQIAVSKYGAGSLTFGNQITATDPVNGVYTGSTRSVMTVSNSNPGTGLTSGGATFLSLTSAGIIGPANPSGSWTRMFAFRYTGPTPTGLDMTVLWSCFDRQRANNLPGGSQLFWKIDSGGKIVLVMGGPTSNSAAYVPSSTSVADSNWHLAIASYSHSNATLIVSVDGAAATWPGIAQAQEPTGLVSDSVGAWVDPTVGNGTTWNYKGDLSFVAEFPSAISTTDMSNLYTAWKNSFTGDSTNTRYNRILAYAGWKSLTSIQAGLTTSMGPADFAGQDALTALQSVVDTEGGAHYIARDGTITFRARSARYNSLTPMYTFGERVDLGEYPYEDCALDYDPTRLSNQVTVTQKSTGQVFAAQDSASVAAYLPRTLSRTVNSSSSGECQDAAGYLLSRYKQPATRVAAIKLHPSANPALWPVLLGMELGTRVRVMRRPPGLNQIQVDCFVESIQWDMDDNGEAFVTLQCSPADLTPYGSFAAWHTTLGTTVGSGVTSITVNASQDNANLLAAQLAAGTQIVLGQNTVTQETVTVLAVGATSPGWTSATITLTAATTKGHTAGDLINELLPTGTTDPTTWDTVSAFDANAFAY